MEKEKDEGKGSGHSPERDSTAKGESCGSDSPRPGGDDEEAQISPVREKIGEGEGNLRRREGWYRRRTGG